jgi:hypothetical protein
MVTRKRGGDEETKWRKKTKGGLKDAKHSINREER